MKDKADLIKGWLRKANSDMVALSASLEAGAFDVACFHAQQASEKYLKAFLIHAGVAFPFTHNLAKLVDLCGGVDPSFRLLVSIVEPLTPYAVELRYDHEFWPGREVAENARDSALIVRKFVTDRLPPEIT
jgi:HEPN domain-containing protein